MRLAVFTLFFALCAFARKREDAENSLNAILVRVCMQGPCV